MTEKLHTYRILVKMVNRTKVVTATSKTIVSKEIEPEQPTTMYTIL